MQVYFGVEALKAPFSGSVVSLGNFDGLHLGHRELIRQSVESARRLQLPSIVFTFSPHPIQVLAPEKGFLPLFPRADLVAELPHLGVEALILQPFTTAFAALSPERFIAEFLVRPLQPRQVWVGRNFAFGRGRTGNVKHLENDGKQNSYSVQSLLPVEVDGAVVSSSRIRKLISEGQVVEAGRLLGRNFYIDGQVEAGAGRGQGLGFATANFTPKDVVTPKRGVYITCARIGENAYPAITNVGGAPTFNEQPTMARLETHILDQDLQLKGVQIRVEFLSYVREERRFSSATELVQQIQMDVTVARDYWQKHSK